MDRDTRLADIPAGYTFICDDGQESHAAGWDFDLDGETIADAMAECVQMEKSVYGGNTVGPRVLSFAVCRDNGNEGLDRDDELWADGACFDVGEHPDCTVADQHRWVDGPVTGKGGGVLYVDTCEHCSMTRTTDTWDQDWSGDGEPHKTVTYKEARW